MQIHLFVATYKDDVLHLKSPDISTDIASRPTVVCGGCQGRIFVGTSSGHIYELQYHGYLLHMPFSSHSSRRHLSGISLGWRKCKLNGLGWASPIQNRAVVKLTVHENSKILIVVGAANTMALFTLGGDNPTSPIRRVATEFPNAGHFGQSTLIDVVPIESQECMFRGMCIYSDGRRLRFTVTYLEGFYWNTANWASDGWFYNQCEMINDDRPIPVLDERLNRNATVTAIRPSSDGTSWLVCEELDRVQSFSVMQYLAAEPTKRIENGAVFLRRQYELPHGFLSVATHEAKQSVNFEGFERETDFISQQCNPALTRHIVLDTQSVSILRVRPPIEQLHEILKIQFPQQLSRCVEQFCRLYGKVETAAMLCLIGRYHPVQIKSVFGRQDLFEKAKKVKRTRLMPPTIPPPQQNATERQPFVENQRPETEDDIEFSDTFKGVLLILRQIVKPFWWKKLFTIAQDPSTGQLKAEKELSHQALFWTVQALDDVRHVVGEYVKPFDPRLSEQFIFPTEVDQIEIHEMMSLLYSSRLYRSPPYRQHPFSCLQAVHAAMP